MGKWILSIFGMMMFVVCTVGLMMVVNNKQDNQDIERSVSLASKTLVNAIEREGGTYDDVSDGFTGGNSEILKVNKEFLVNDFFRTLEGNFSTNEYYESDLDVRLDNGKDPRFLKVKKSIPMMLLTRTDHFYYATPKLENSGSVSSPRYEINDPEDVQYSWSSPIVYSIRGGQVNGGACVGEYRYELDLESRTVEKYQLSGSYIGEVDVSEACYQGEQMDLMVRDQAVIDLVNGYVNVNTSRSELPFYMKADIEEKGMDDSLKLERGLQLMVSPGKYDVRLSSESGVERTRFFKANRSTLEVKVNYRDGNSASALGIQLLDERGRLVDEVLNPEYDHQGKNGQTYQVLFEGLDKGERYQLRAVGSSLDWDIVVEAEALGNTGLKNDRFNMLDGITFMVIYSDADVVPMVRDDIVDYRFNLTGYTVRWDQ